MNVCWRFTKTCGGKLIWIAYVGDDDNDHSMDVEALAPALLAFGKLIRAANANLNRDRTTMKVLVDSEFEHKCSRRSCPIPELQEAR